MLNGQQAPNSLSIHIFKMLHINYLMIGIHKEESIYYQEYGIYWLPLSMKMLSADDRPKFSDFYLFFCLFVLFVCLFVYLFFDSTWKMHWNEWVGKW